MRCRHKARMHHLWGEYEQQWGEAPHIPQSMSEATSCADCGETLPLGTANDASPEVQVEIRAAELAAVFARGVGIGGHRPEHCTGEHCWHWFESDWSDDADSCCYCGHDGIVLPGVENECHAGYLARCIADHEEG